MTRTIRNLTMYYIELKSRMSVVLDGTKRLKLVPLRLLSLEPRVSRNRARQRPLPRCLLKSVLWWSSLHSIV